MSTSDNTLDVYKPIDCSLHDQLEVFAIQNKEISIEYNDLGSVVKLDAAVIETTISRDKEEYLKLVTGEVIRLDRLLLVDGLAFKQPTM